MNLRVEPLSEQFSDLPNCSAGASSPSAAEQVAERPVTVAHGDGIGPEIMEAALKVMSAAGAKLKIESASIGKVVHDQGEPSGISAEGWDSIRRTKVLFRAPSAASPRIGHRPVDVTLRNSLGLFANVRRSASCHPFIQTRYPGLDVILVQENAPDMCAAVEYRHTDDVYQTVSVFSREGCERIVRYAFQLARQAGRKKVSCLTRRDVMPLSDGMCQQVFADVARQNADIESEHLPAEAGVAQIASEPGRFDVVVLPGLHGRIWSDLLAEAAGPPGTWPSANIGPAYATFEGLQGIQPALAGKDVANPSGLLLAGVMMLIHLGQPKVAEDIHNAWLRTIEEGYRTFDMFAGTASSQHEVGTESFASMVIAHLGERPRSLRPVSYPKEKQQQVAMAAKPERQPAARKDLVGVDVFVHWRGQQSRILAETLRCAEDRILELKLMTNRGLKVWPNAFDEAFKTDHWCCRFVGRQGQSVTHSDVAELQSKLSYLGVDFVKTEHLYRFGDEPGFGEGHAS